MESNHEPVSQKRLRTLDSLYTCMLYIIELCHTIKGIKASREFKSFFGFFMLIHCLRPIAELLRAIGRGSPMP